jgi:phosphopantothenoylcysteine decarboxylase/phosphopantothenate--cysteine ligase
MKILVAAGPTREWIDPVRFLSNASSGRMGFACAREARRRGHRVVLVAGPTSEPPPPGTVRVETTRQMLSALRRRFGWCDALIMTAAPADFAPAARARAKIKKTGRPAALRLVPTPDILAALARRKGRRLIVGFALESHALVRRARAKMAAKRMDLVAANAPQAAGARCATVTLLTPDGGRETLRGATKERIARRILDWIGARK